MCNICRTCMSEAQEMISIFGEREAPTINAMIMEISPLMFLANDGLPQQICIPCLEAIQISYYFKKTMLKCNNTLQEQAQSSRLLALQVKQEDDGVFYNEQNEENTNADSDEERSGNVDDRPGKCFVPLESIEKHIYCDTKLESDIESVHLDMAQDDDLSEGNSPEDTKAIDELNTDDSEFCSEDDLPLSRLRINTGSYKLCLDDRQNSKDNGNTRIDIEKHRDYNINSNTQKCDETRNDIKRVPLKSQHGNAMMKDPSRDTTIRNKCEVCEKSFYKQTKLKIHMRTHTNERPFKCLHCTMRFITNSALTVHNRTHTGDKPFKCQQCDARFTDSSNLNRHIRRHTGDKPFKCQLCTARFARKSGLTGHNRTHTGEKPYKCKQCNARFIDSSSLCRHNRTHTGEKPFKCQQCTARFARSEALVIHNRTHTGEKPYKCQQCNASFTTNSQLNLHNRTHTGEKPFKCQHCTARYTRSETLVVHNRIHTGEKPYKCQQCNARFAKSSSLNRHNRTHTGEKP